MTKNLLVTGGCGFIGSNFINYYWKSNPICGIVNIDAMYYCADINNVIESIRTSDRYTLVQENLCTCDLLYILRKYNIDSVIHFAAQSHVQNSFTDSIQYTKDNILGTHTLLEACRVYGKVEKFIHVSTDEVYGESMIKEGETKKTEESVLCPTNPYAATKAGAELIAQSYYHSFKMPIIITRGNNVYGPNQYPEKLIPRFIKLLKEGKKVTIQGDGSNVRSFLHVLDVCSAFSLILEKGVIGEIYNIGSDDNSERSMLDIAKILIKMIKKTDKFEDWIEYIEDRPFNDKRYYIHNQKLKDIGWDIKVGLIEGLKELVFTEYKQVKMIDTDYLNTIKFNLTDVFGSWVDTTNEMAKTFTSATPFGHVIIDNFLNANYAEKIHDDFPAVEEITWNIYDNPIEKKFANDDINSMPEDIKNLFYYMSSPEVIKMFGEISGIQNLEYDEYLHGAGLHVHPTGGRLEVHLDYEKHPLTGKERRLNVIIYLSKDWNDEWNGHTELWSDNECKVKSRVGFNRAIVFKTNDDSWHGLPDEIRCPEGVLRKTFAYYYVSPPTNVNKTHRLKAKFIATNNRRVDERLFEIRANRRLKIEDKFL
jgi:dTDP-glucose 4,6-dehydratase